MGQAFLCDRCKEYQTGIPSKLGDASIVMDLFKPRYYPEYFELCQACKDDLRKILKSWWDLGAK